MRGFGLLFAFLTCYQCFFLARALQRADFDIYPTLVSSTDNERDSGKSIGQTILKVGNAVGFGGCAFLGFKFAQSLLRKDNSAEVSSEYVSNSTVIEELKKEQEEIWRVVHSLFKSQEDKLVALDAALKERGESTSEELLNIKQLESTLDTVSGKLASRIDAIESQLNALEKLSESTYAELKQSLQDEVKELNKTLEALRNDVTSQMLKWLKEHDNAVVEKIRLFGEDIKRLVKGSPKSKHSSSSSSSSSKH
jgi:septal ring factor EnvC (AmiA/AmiB activator)